MSANCGRRAETRDRRGGREERIGRRHHLVARSDARAISIASSASVPDDTPTACATPDSAAASRSNAATSSTEKELPRGEDARRPRAQFVEQRRVLRLEIQHRNSLHPATILPSGALTIAARTCSLAMHVESSWTDQNANCAGAHGGPADRRLAPRRFRRTSRIFELATASSPLSPLLSRWQTTLCPAPLARPSGAIALVTSRAT